MSAATEPTASPATGEWWCKEDAYYVGGQQHLTTWDASHTFPPGKGTFIVAGGIQVKAKGVRNVPVRLTPAAADWRAWLIFSGCNEYEGNLWYRIWDGFKPSTAADRETEDLQADIRRRYNNMERVSRFGKHAVFVQHLRHLWVGGGPIHVRLPIHIRPPIWPPLPRGLLRWWHVAPRTTPTTTTGAGRRRQRQLLKATEHVFFAWILSACEQRTRPTRGAVSNKSCTGSLRAERDWRRPIGTQRHERCQAWARARSEVPDANRGVRSA